VVDPFRREKEALGMDPVIVLVDSNVLMSIFNNKMMTPEEAFVSVKECKRLSSAFHRDWVIGWKMAADTPCLLYRDNVVGEFDGDVVKINEAVMFLKEEIESFGLGVSINET
jgi:hypothetical protein